MGQRTTPPSFDAAVFMITETRQRLSVFPLGGAILFPRSMLPLHIFEPRYRALVSDSLARDRRIAMIQPRVDGLVPELYSVGCVGRIAQVEALDDGRFNIVLEGIARFRTLKELSTTTPFRQIEAEFGSFDDESDEPLPHILRADFEREGKRFCKARGIMVNWEALAEMDDEAVINGSAQVAPFDIASKQALLEAPTLTERADLLIQLLRFYREQGDGEEKVTLQ